MKAEKFSLKTCKRRGRRGFLAHQKVSLETCKQEEGQVTAKMSADKVKRACCCLEARLHADDEFLEAAASLVGTHAIHQAQIDLEQEEQKRFDWALDEFVAVLISGARLLCQDQKEKQEQYLEESVFKNEARTGGGEELADSILSADAMCSAGAYIVSNTPQSPEQSLLQPPLLDIHATSDEDAQQMCQPTSCALPELTAAVAEFNSQLVQVAVPASCSTHARTHACAQSNEVVNKNACAGR